MNAQGTVDADPAAIRALGLAWVEFMLEIAHAASELRNVIDEVAPELESIPHVIGSAAELAAGADWTANQLDPIRLDLIQLAELLEQYLHGSGAVVPGGGAA
ncbi:hypothetical protein [Geodermatophilus sp. SYSU D01119]